MLHVSTINGLGKAPALINEFTLRSSSEMQPLIRVLSPCLLLANVQALANEFHPTWRPGSIGPKVSGQAAACREKVFSFGGLLGSAGSPTTDELWAFDDGRWTKVKTGARTPGRRMYAASAMLEGAFYMFGGWDPGAPGSGGTFKDDSWRLDLESLEWKPLAQLPCGPVSRHTAVTVGDKIVLHTFREKVVVCEGEVIREQSTSGEAPVGVSMCAAAALGADAMLIFGGSTKTQGMSADAFVLDTRTWAWRKLRPTSVERRVERPSPRGSCCAAAIDPSTCIVFGGAGLGGGGYQGGSGLTPFDETWKLTVDGEECHWERLSVEAPLPAARVAASLSALPSGELLLHGGWSPSTKETFDESWLLNVAPYSWTHD
jgi:hypothetical protein